MQSIRFLFCCIISCWVLPAQCQTNYYSQENGIFRLASGSVFTYRNHYGIFIELYNADAAYIDVEWGMADGSPVSYDMLIGEVKSIRDGNMTPTEVQRLISSCFSSSQKFMVEGEQLLVELIISPSTGEVLEVHFSIFKHTSFRYIPPEVYDKIERTLKERLHFTLTTAGKELNYAMVVWSQEVW